MQSNSAIQREALPPRHQASASDSVNQPFRARDYAYNLRERRHDESLQTPLALQGSSSVPLSHTDRYVGSISEAHERTTPVHRQDPAAGHFASSGPPMLHESPRPLRDSPLIAGMHRPPRFMRSPAHNNGLAQPPSRFNHSVRATPSFRNDTPGTVVSQPLPERGYAPSSLSRHSRVSRPQSWGPTRGAASRSARSTSRSARRAGYAESSYHPAKDLISQRKNAYVARDPFHKWKQPKATHPRTSYDHHASVDNISDNTDRRVPPHMQHFAASIFPPRNNTEDLVEPHEREDHASAADNVSNATGRTVPRPTQRRASSIFPSGNSTTESVEPHESWYPLFGTGSQGMEVSTEPHHGAITPEQWSPTLVVAVPPARESQRIFKLSSRRRRTSGHSSVSDRAHLASDSGPGNLTYPEPHLPHLHPKTHVEPLLDRPTSPSSFPFTASAPPVSHLPGAFAARAAYFPTNPSRLRASTTSPIHIPAAPERSNNPFAAPPSDSPTSSPTSDATLFVLPESLMDVEKQDHLTQHGSLHTSTGNLMAWTSQILNWQNQNEDEVPINLTEQEQRPGLIVLTTQKVSTSLYSSVLLFLPSLYFSRVGRLFEEADLAMEEIDEMALNTSILGQNLWDEFQAEPPKQWARLKSEWEHFIDCLLREWTTFNVISVLLLSAILTTLQISDAANDYLTRYTALLSFICSLVSLLFGCTYIIRFGTMRKPHKAAEWAMEAQQSTTSTWWNVFILLALPSIWLTWSILLYIVCIMSYVWRTAANVQESQPPLSDRTVFKIRLAISILLGIALIYGCFVFATFRRYGSAMDVKWASRVEGWRDDVAAYVADKPLEGAPWEEPEIYPLEANKSKHTIPPAGFPEDTPSFPGNNQAQVRDNPPVMPIPPRNLRSDENIGRRQANHPHHDVPSSTPRSYSADSGASQPRPPEFKPLVYLPKPDVDVPAPGRDLSTLDLPGIPDPPTLPSRPVLRGLPRRPPRALLNDSGGSNKVLSAKHELFNFIPPPPSQPQLSTISPFIPPSPKPSSSNPESSSPSLYNPSIPRFPPRAVLNELASDRVVRARNASFDTMPPLYSLFIPQSPALPPFIPQSPALTPFIPPSPSISPLKRRSGGRQQVRFRDDASFISNEHRQGNRRPQRVELAMGADYTDSEFGAPYFSPAQGSITSQGRINLSELSLLATPRIPASPLLAHYRSHSNSESIENLSTLSEPPTHYNQQLHSTDTERLSGYTIPSYNEQFTGRRSLLLSPAWTDHIGLPMIAEVSETRTETSDNISTHTGPWGQAAQISTNIFAVTDESGDQNEILYLADSQEHEPSPVGPILDLSGSQMFGH